ncbi:MAG: glycosyltransferase [Candidatus Sericytochromatia bacterium]
MKILLASTPVAPLGGGFGGGVDFTIKILANELIKKNHLVEIIAPKNSILETYAKIIEVDGINQNSVQNQDFYTYQPIFSNSVLTKMWEFIIKKQANYDVIVNFAYDWLPFYLTPTIKTPVVNFVSMSAVSNEMKEIIYNFSKNYSNRLVMYTKTQKETFDIKEDIFISGIGLDLNNYNYSLEHENYIIWLGRISQEKGLEDAFELAKEKKIKLKIAGKIQDEQYWSDLQKKYNKIDFEYLGFLNTNELQKQTSKALALIFTSKWIEAFGIVIIEALACGTPVIAYNLGGPSEIIKNNYTGFLVNPNESIKGFSEAFDKISDINRENCRNDIIKNYSAEIFSKKLECFLLEQILAKKDFK